MSDEKKDNPQINGLQKDVVHKSVLKSSDSALSSIEALEFPALEPLVSAKQEVNTTEGLSPFTSWLLSLGVPAMVEEFQAVNTAVNMDQSPSTPETEVKREAGRSDIKKRTKESKVKVEAKKQSKKKKKSKKKKARTASSSDDGVLLAPGVYSETLAEILENQGYIEQAIEMYQKLSLKNPEKSRFFAARIEKLREQNR